MTASNADGAVVVVLATFPDEAVAGAVAVALVSEGLVACVNLLPAVRSVYRWQGAVETASEVLAVMKTRAGGVDDVVARVKALHPYEVPEVIALPVVAGLPASLQWVISETTTKTDTLKEPAP